MCLILRKSKESDPDWSLRDGYHFASFHFVSEGHIFIPEATNGKREQQRHPHGRRLSTNATFVFCDPPGQVDFVSYQHPRRP